MPLRALPPAEARKGSSRPGPWLRGCWRTACRRRPSAPRRTPTCSTCCGARPRNGHGSCRSRCVLPQRFEPGQELAPPDPKLSIGKPDPLRSAAKLPPAIEGPLGHDAQLSEDLLDGHQLVTLVRHKAALPIGEVSPLSSARCLASLSAA